MIEAVLKYNLSELSNLDKLIEVSFFNVTNPKLEELLNNIISERQDNSHIYIKEAKKYTNLIDENITMIDTNNCKIKHIKKNIFYIFSPRLHHQIKDYRLINEKLIKDNATYKEKIENLKGSLKNQVNGLFNELGFKNVYKESSNTSETNKYIAILDDDYIYALAQQYIDKNLTDNKDNKEKDKALNQSNGQNQYKNHINQQDTDKNNISKDNKYDRQL